MRYANARLRDDTRGKPNRNVVGGAVFVRTIYAHENHRSNQHRDRHSNDCKRWVHRDGLPAGGATTARAVIGISPSGSSPRASPRAFSTVVKNRALHFTIRILPMIKSLRVNNHKMVSRNEVKAAEAACAMNAELVWATNFPNLSQLKNRLYFH